MFACIDRLCYTWGVGLLLRVSGGPAANVSMDIGEWLSLVEHLVRDQGVGGSNPLSPTIVFPI